MSELTGKLIVKEDVVQVTDNFKKREFVIEVINERDEKYNDFLKFQLTQDKCAYLDKFAIGQTLNIAYNIRGRKFEKEGKVMYFTTLEAWKVFLSEESKPSEENALGKNHLGIEEDSLPF